MYGGSIPVACTGVLSLMHYLAYLHNRCQVHQQGRKYDICSCRLGLIRSRSNRRIQQVKALILDKVRYTNDTLLPHALLHGASAIHKQCSIVVPHTLQSRALKNHAEQALLFHFAQSPLGAEAGQAVGQLPGLWAY